ncbi:MAG: nitroreductase family protein [Microthrixaceae bacterium]
MSDPVPPPEEPASGTEPDPPAAVADPGALDPEATDLVLGVLASTRAVRRYRPEPVPDDVLARLLFAATRAPSGSNRQGFRFLVLRDGPGAVAAKALIGGAARELWAAKEAADGYGTGSGAAPDSPKARTARTMRAFVDGFEDIPVVILAGMLRHRGGTDELLGASVYPACQNLLVAARASGYGGVMMTWHRAVEPQLREALAIPDDVFLAATITLGRPVGGTGTVRRAELRHLVFEDRWGESPEWAVDPEGSRFTRWRG